MSRFSGSPLFKIKRNYETIELKISLLAKHTCFWLEFLASWICIVIVNTLCVFLRKSHWVGWAHKWNSWNKYPNICQCRHKLNHCYFQFRVLICIKHDRNIPNWHLSLCSSRGHKFFSYCRILCSWFLE